MRAEMSLSIGGSRQLNDKRTRRRSTLLFLLCVLAACAPPDPGNAYCVDDGCAICSGWDCSNSFIDENHPRPLSFASRQSVTECYQGFDEATKDLADGHFEPLARTGPLTWGPSRVWAYQELQAWELVVSDVKACMEQQGWIYCCRGNFCDYNFVQSRHGRWICLREPGA